MRTPSTVRTPSKFIRLEVLKYLRENHYISKTGAEYVKDEVDTLFFEKSNTIAERETYNNFKKKWTSGLKRVRSF